MRLKTLLVSAATALTCLSQALSAEPRPLQGRTVAILVEDLYQENELWYPYYRLQEAGAKVILVGPEKKRYVTEHGFPAWADAAAETVDPSTLAAIVIPGGYAPDKLRHRASILNLVRSVHAKGGVIASICHSAWVPISAGILKGRKATCLDVIQDDLINAGAKYVDAEVVVDGNLVSSRHPGDLPAFVPAIIKTIVDSETPAR